MNNSTLIICNSFFKSKDENERKVCFNLKWLEIIRYFEENRTKKSFPSDLQISPEYTIIESDGHSFHSANLKQRGAE